MQENIELKQLEEKIDSLHSELSSLQGQCDLLQEQSTKSKNKLEDLEHKKELFKKAVELLTIVEQSTKEVVKKGFEEIVTYALQYILSSNGYSLELNFGRRGNLTEVDFNLISPDCKEPSDPLLSSGGGVLDILSLALRVSMLEIVKPKIPGFLALDEPFRHLSSEYLENARNFLKSINRRINRQIIVVTHKQSLVINADRAIKIGGQDEKETSSEKEEN